MTLEKILFFGSVLFLFSMLFQIAVWHFFLIKKEITVLALLYFIFPLAAFMAFAVYESMDLWDAMLIALFHCIASSCFVLTYPALKGDIPSLRVLKFVLSNPGTHATEVIKALTKHPAFKSRKLKELETEQLARFRGDRLILTRKGRLIAVFFYFFRKLIN